MDRPPRKLPNFKKVPKSDASSTQGLTQARVITPTTTTHNSRSRSPRYRSRNEYAGSRHPQSPPPGHCLPPPLGFSGTPRPQQYSQSHTTFQSGQFRRDDQRDARWGREHSVLSSASRDHPPVCDDQRDRSSPSVYRHDSPVENRRHSSSRSPTYIQGSQTRSRRHFRSPSPAYRQDSPTRGRRRQRSSSRSDPRSPPPASSWAQESSSSWGSPADWSQSTRYGPPPRAPRPLRKRRKRAPSMASDSTGSSEFAEYSKLCKTIVRKASPSTFEPNNGRRGTPEFTPTPAPAVLSSAPRLATPPPPSSGPVDFMGVLFETPSPPHSSYPSPSRYVTPAFTPYDPGASTSQDVMSDRSITLPVVDKSQLMVVEDPRYGPVVPLPNLALALERHRLNDRPITAGHHDRSVQGEFLSVRCSIGH